MSSNVSLHTPRPAAVLVAHIVRKFKKGVMIMPSTRPPAIPTSQPAELIRRASSIPFLLLVLAALLLLVAQPVSAQQPPSNPVPTDTPVVSFGSAAYQVTEGDGAIEIDVRAVGAHPGFTVSATAVVGTASSTDFTAGTWPLEFGVGDSVVWLSIPIASDAVADYALEAAAEVFTVNLSEGSDYALGDPAAATVTIHDAGYCHTTATPPDKPSFTSVTPAETSITLTWNAPSTMGSGPITDFIFLVYSTDDGQHVPVTNVMGSASAAHNYSKTISGLTADTTYLVKMRARTILGCYSSYTDEASVTTHAGSTQ